MITLDDVTITHDVILSFDPKFAGLTRFCG